MRFNVPRDHRHGLEPENLCELLDKSLKSLGRHDGIVKMTQQLVVM
jgi:hypothetical protein